MNDYNGFSGRERAVVYQLQKELVRAGEVPDWRNEKCDICSGNGGLIMAHTEDYSDPFDIVPLCVECHMKLHARFKNPTAWIKHLIDVGRRGYVPTQWRTVVQYFNRQEWEEYPEYADVDPATLGNKWYHKLKLYEVNLKNGKRKRN